MKDKKKVFVGLSGGVDSSVSAALLKELGYDVTGVFIKVWSPDWLPCTWREERRDAMRVAAHLDIPFATLDLEKEYKKEVVDYMVAEYRAGRVPNPDVMCNKTIKFGTFFDWAMKNGADFIATGHYARLAQPTTDPKYHSEAGCWAGKQQPTTKLLKGVDENKDQTYFLWTLTQEQLAHTLFPVGGYKKSEVREFAEKFNLPTARKKDSQGICFVGKVDMMEFLKHFIDVKYGDVINESGEKIGQHSGAFFYTIGQRHGFTITSKTTKDSPYYVVNKDMDSNTITVSHNKADKDFARKDIILDHANWIDYEPAKGKKKYTAKLWYRGKPQICTISRKLPVTISFDEPKNIALGQSAVLYDGDICLGGGIAV